MPEMIIINIPMMYHCVLHVQRMSLISAASTAFIHCIAIFATKAFNLDCLYTIYIIIIAYQNYNRGCEYKYIS